MTVAQRSTANRLIADKGQTVTLTSRAAGSYNPATGAASVTTSTQTAKAVLLPKSGLRNQGNAEVPAGDVQCLLSAMTTAGAVLTAPQVNDTVTDVNSRVLTVIEVAPLAPDGTAVMYDLTLRGHS